MEMFGDFRLLLLLFISPFFLFDAAVGIAIFQLRMICEHEKPLYLWLYLFSIFKADLSFLCLPLQLVVKLLSLLAQHWGKGVSFMGRLGKLGSALRFSASLQPAQSTHSALLIHSHRLGHSFSFRSLQLAGKGIPLPSHSAVQSH